MFTDTFFTDPMIAYVVSMPLSDEQKAFALIALGLVHVGNNTIH